MLIESRVRRKWARSRKQPLLVMEMTIFNRLWDLSHQIQRSIESDTIGTRRLVGTDSLWPYPSERFLTIPEGL